MGAGAFIEPLVVVSLLVGGTLINRETKKAISSQSVGHKRDDNLESALSTPRSANSQDGLLSPVKLPEHNHGHWTSDQADEPWQIREIGLLGWTRQVRSPNTQQFQSRRLSRLLQRLPFLVEVWYWALIYWVYQLGRAFTAVTLVQGTVHTARRHALQLVHLEQRMHIFWEPAIQNFFLQSPTTMHWINRIYSFIHIPGTILFLIGLFFFTITAHRTAKSSERQMVQGSTAGAALYQARRRTMATCNLIAFVVFTLWPCMPPRLLSDPAYERNDAAEAKSYGFVDTVHGADGESSVWTQNKFCNQYAAMPSLHFGYSLLIGLSVATIPLARNDWAHPVKIWRFRSMKLHVPSSRRMTCVVLGLAYPMIILVAIIATANHFILDAVAGAMVCGVAWNSERLLLNLLPLEDWFLWCLRMHKPEVSLDADVWDEKAGVRRSSDSS